MQISIGIQIHPFMDSLRDMNGMSPMNILVRCVDWDTQLHNEHMRGLHTEFQRIVSVAHRACSDI